MPHYLKVAALGAVAVVAFDIAMSLASRQFGIPYTRGLLGSTAIYLFVGWFAARGAAAGGQVPAAALAGALVGLADASIGWAVSWYLGPGRTDDGIMSLTRWLGTALFVTALAAAVASIGGVAAKRSYTPPSHEA